MQEPKLKLTHEQTSLRLQLGVIRNGGLMALSKLALWILCRYQFFKLLILPINCTVKDLYSVGWLLPKNYAQNLLPNFKFEGTM